MLSKRAINTIKTMRGRWARGSAMGGWSWAGGFMLIPPGDVEKDLVAAKKSGLLKGIGKTTINEIVQFHKDLNKTWE